MTDVTIRGIDDEIYALFSAEARKRGIPIGELVTLVMRAFLDKTNEMEQNEINSISHIEVSFKDLNEVEGRVGFSNISKLEFMDDVTWDLFSKKVAYIRNVAKLTVPGNFPRLGVLAMCKHVVKLIMR
jgi:hypothetical protein